MEYDKQLEQSIEWIRTNQERFWTIVGVGAMAVALLAFAIRHRQTETDEAWTQLGPLQGQVMQSPTPAVAKSLDDWDKRFGGTSAGAYAKFLKADLLYRTSSYAEAAQVYGELAERASPIEMRPLALSGQSSAEEMAGQLPKALAVAQSFTQRYPDHFLAASMYLAQARLQEATGNSAGASATYDRLAILYPQSPWTPLARARIQALGGAAIPPPTK